MSDKLDALSCLRVAATRSSTSAGGSTGLRLTRFAGFTAGSILAGSADRTALIAWRRLIFNFHLKVSKGDAEQLREVDRRCRNRHHVLVDLNKRRHGFVCRLGGWQDREQSFADGIKSRRDEFACHAILRRSSIAWALMNKRCRESPGSRDAFLSLVFLIALRMRRTASSREMEGAYSKLAV